MKIFESVLTPDSISGVAKRTWSINNCNNIFERTQQQKRSMLEKACLILYFHYSFEFWIVNTQQKVLNKNIKKIFNCFVAKYFCVLQHRCRNETKFAITYYQNLSLQFCIIPLVIFTNEWCLPTGNLVLCASMRHPILCWPISAIRVPATHPHPILYMVWLMSNYRLLICWASKSMILFARQIQPCPRQHWHRWPDSLIGIHLPTSKLFWICFCVQRLRRSHCDYSRFVLLLATISSISASSLSLSSSLAMEDLNIDLLIKRVENLQIDENIQQQRTPHLN